MIKSSKVLSLAEVKKLLEKQAKQESEEENKRLQSTLSYAKRFSKLKPAQAEDLKKELQELKLVKLKEEHIAKILDLLPKDAEDLRKIFVGEAVSLDQDEINKILTVVKKY